MQEDYRDVVARLRARIGGMLPRELVAYKYAADPDFIQLREFAAERHSAQVKYLAFCAAARGAYLTARGKFMDAEDTYLAAAEPFRVLAKIAREHLS